MATQCVIRAESKARDMVMNKRHSASIYTLFVLWRHKLEEKQLRYQKQVNLQYLHRYFCLLLFNLSKLLELLLKTLMSS